MHGLLLLIAAVILWALLHRAGKLRSYKAICRNCESVAQSRIVSPRNLFIEILLWFCGLIPGVLYTLWCNHETMNTCRKCGSKDIIPLDSPAGQKLAGTHSTKDATPISQQMRQP